MSFELTYMFDVFITTTWMELSTDERCDDLLNLATLVHHCNYYKSYSGITRQHATPLAPYSKGSFMVSSFPFADTIWNLCPLYYAWAARVWPHSSHCGVSYSLHPHFIPCSSSARTTSILPHQEKPKLLILLITCELSPVARLSSVTCPPFI